MPLSEDHHSLSVGEIVELYKLDLQHIGGSEYFFTPTQRSDGGVITFQGITYVPIDIHAEGFETSSKGPFPQPTVRIANVSRAITGLVRTLDDLIGAKLTRIRTLGKYLDGQPAADPGAHYPPDVYFVEQKSAETKLFIEFKLTSAIDIEGQKLPRRRVVRNYCSHVYRKWNVANGSFDYVGVTCPYTGNLFYDINGNPAFGWDDKCGKRLSDCQKRFGRAGWLPSRAFPGAGRFGA